MFVLLNWRGFYPLNPYNMQYVSLVGTAVILQSFQKPREIYNDHWGIKVTTFKNIFKE